MPLSHQERQTLEKHKKQYTDEAARLLLRENDMKGAEQALQKVDLSERILAQNSKPPPRQLYISLVFALLCFALVSFAWNWHLPNPRVHL